MIVFQATPTIAQWTPGVGAPPNIFYNGLTGIGPFNNVTPFTASRLLHVHSSNFLTNGGNIHAFLRLQTQIPASGEFGLNRFGETGIEFFSGSILNGGLQWCTGKILGISNGHGLLNSDEYKTPGSVEFRGGLAFFCSPQISTAMPQEGDQIEVMRIVNEKVGIKTRDPLGQLDVNVGNFPTNETLGKISLTSGITSTDASPQPQIRLYVPSGNDYGTYDRAASYSWYIQSLRQSQSACFLGINGARDGADENTVMGALHFRAGYSPTEQYNYEHGLGTHPGNVGDVYQTKIGEEVTIPRMSLLSNGNVGINNEIPMTRFQVSDGAVLFDGTQGSTPKKRYLTPSIHSDEIGAGTRLMWIPDKAAFRAGIIDNYNESASLPSHVEYDPDYDVALLPLDPPIHQDNKTYGWNSTNIGMYSFATGRNTRAEGKSDIAMGLNSVANSGVKHGAIAIGHTNLSTGEDAVTLGFANKATAKYGIAIGSISEATGIGSMALGRNNKVSEGFAFGNSCESTDGMAIGFTAKSTAEDAISMGSETINPHSSSLKVAFGEYADPMHPTKASLFVSSSSVSMGCESAQNRLDINGAVALGWGDGGTGSISTIPTAPDNSLVVGGMIGINDGNPENRLDVNGSAAIGFGTAASPVQDNSLAVAEKVGIGTISTTGCNLGVDGTACIGWNGTAAFSSGSGGRFISLMVESGVVLGGSGGTTPAYVAGTESGNNSFLNVWGDASKLDADAAASWDIPSDARYKKEVHSFDDGLQLLKQINPVRFKYSEELGIPGSDKEEGIGVLAQDMQKIAPYTVHDNMLKKSIQTKEEKRYQVDDQDTIIKRVIDYSKVDNSQPDTLLEEEKHYEYKDTTVYKPTKRWVIEPAEYRTDSMPLLTYNPSALTYVIINSIKEIDSLRTADKQALIEKINIQNKVINSQNSTIDSLILANKNFEERIARLETKNEISLNEVSDVILEQNNPNPFSENTTITYYIPDKVQGDAELVIAPAASQSPALQKYPLTKGTPTQLNISAQDLYTGVFVYSITVSGKVIVSKKFIIIK